MTRPVLGSMVVTACLPLRAPSFVMSTTILGLTVPAGNVYLCRAVFFVDVNSTRMSLVYDVMINYSSVRITPVERTKLVEKYPGDAKSSGEPKPLQLCVSYSKIEIIITICQELARNRARLQ